MRRLQPSVSARDPIRYVPPPPAPPRSLTPGHHLARSRPLWDPEVTVKPRTVIPEHMRPSSVLSIGNSDQAEHRGRKVSYSRVAYNPITHDRI